jgi:hypothetical protein
VKEQWNQIWNLKCPRKIRQYILRFTHNTLAVNRNLERRGIELDTRCIMCNRYIEDGGHLFFKCKCVKDVWRELTLEDQRCKLAKLLTVNSCIKVCLDLQADKSPVVVKGPFFPRVVNPRYRFRGTNV